MSIMLLTFIYHITEQCQIIPTQVSTQLFLPLSQLGLIFLLQLFTILHFQHNIKKQMNNDANNKSKHQQHLKSCKKIYDQLHNHNTRILIIKRDHLSENQQQRRYYSHELFIANSLTKDRSKKASLPKIMRNIKSNEMLEKNRRSENLTNNIKKQNEAKISYKQKNPQRSTGFEKVYEESSKQKKQKQVSFRLQKPKANRSSSTNNYEGTPKKLFWGSRSQNFFNPKQIEQQFRTYLSLIQAQSKQYNLHFNFQKIRAMQNIQAWQQLDVKNTSDILNVVRKITKNIIAKQSIHTSKDSEEQRNKQINQRLLRYCRVFFNNFERVKTQIILTEHYFKMFVFRLKPVFVLQRIAFYFLYQLTRYRILDTPGFRSRILIIFENLKVISETIIGIIHESNRADKMINQAFKILKSVSQVQKKINQIQLELQVIQKLVTVDILSDIYKSLKFYLQENVSHFSYESLVKTQMLLSWKYLHVPPTPFLPKMSQQYEYTAVIDLHQTIVHFDPASRVLKYRPGMDNFFKSLKLLKFQIILFTTDYAFGNYRMNQNIIQATKDQQQLQTSQGFKYVELIIQEIQSRGRIFNFRLFGEHLSLYNGRFIKDIRRLGRDMNSVIIIDDIVTNFGPCIDNAIEVSSWVGDKSDKQLAQIINILQQLQVNSNKSQKQLQNKQIQSQKKDCRQFLRHHQNKFRKILQQQQQKRLNNQHAQEKDIFNAEKNQFMPSQS